MEIVLKIANNKYNDDTLIIEVDAQTYKELINNGRILKIE